MSMLTWEQAVQWLRENPDLQDLVRACYYDDPLLDAAERFRQSLEWKAVVGFLPQAKGGLALDLGAGRGISSYALALEGWKVIALEPDPSALVGSEAIRALAHQTRLPIEVNSEFSEELPFADCSFDLVNCRQVLHHARDLPQTCREIYRVLKPGGFMIATREHVISKRDDLSTFLGIHPLHQLYGGENAFLLTEYIAAISNSGMRIEKCLAPYDSPINYAPMSEAQLVHTYTRPLAKVFGQNVTNMFFRRSNVLGSLFIPALLKFANWTNHRPGRLYSFIANKS